MFGVIRYAYKLTRNFRFHGHISIEIRVRNLAKNCRK